MTDSTLTYDGLAAHSRPKLDHRRPRAPRRWPGSSATAGSPRPRCRAPTRSFPSAAPGSIVEDVDGNIFLDINAGIAVTSTGHCHPKVVEAIQRQSTELLHYSASDFYLPVYSDVCERLDAVAPFGGLPRAVVPVELGDRGGGGGDQACALCDGPAVPDRLLPVVPRTLDGLGHAHRLKAKYRTNFGPMLPSVYHSFYGDFDYLEEVLFKRIVSPTEVAAIVVESWLGEGGYVLPPEGWFRYLRELCDRHGILLVCDEVQSGVGRSGTMWAIEQEGVAPDVITSGKGIASGLPLGAMIARDDLMMWKLGAHGSTYGGSPISCAAALATFDVIEHEGLIDERDGGRRGAARGAPRHRRRGTRSSPTCAAGRCGSGCRSRTTTSRRRSSRPSFRRGLLILGCGDADIRISPPLVFREDQAQAALEIFEEVVAEVEARA